MKTFTEYIGSQFGNPRGMLGTLCCFIMNTMNRAMYLSIIACVKTKNRARILDIGYGNGYLIKQLYKKTGAHIYGIDISDDMLKTAVKKNRKAVEQKRMELFIGDCCDLQFQDDIFDVVTSVNTIYFWKDAKKGLSEICRTLKNGGVFYNAVYSKEWLQKLSYTRAGFQFFEKKDYIKMGKEVGFSKISIKEIIAGKSYIIRYVKD